MRFFQWLFTRIAVIYVIIVIVCLTCVNLKTLDERIKVRRLNQAVPNFTDLINFSMGKMSQQDVNWLPYRRYFELILRYLPDDLITKQLLGYVDYYSGHEDKAIDLLKSSIVIKGQHLFWSNYNLGVIYYKKGMWQQSAEYLFNTLASNPQLAIFFMKDSIIYKQIFANPVLTYSYDEGIATAKSNVYVLLLSCLNKMGQYDKVFAVSSIALADGSLLSKDAFYYYAGLAFFETGQEQKASMFFQKSLTLEKNNPDIYYYLANIYQKAGQSAQARDLLQLSYVLHQKNDPRFPYDAHVALRIF